ncbi:MAG: VOC family protein, partial [Prevotellaceae bacterium]|nr:VOC family protein [Prevotellaceae bacterium]
MNRINVICLGVRDMEKSIRFYRNGLGFQTNE